MYIPLIFRNIKQKFTRKWNNFKKNFARLLISDVLSRNLFVANDELLNNNIFNRQKFFFHEFFPKIISISIPFKLSIIPLLSNLT